MRIKGILYIFIVSSICSIFFSSCAKEGDLGDLMNPFGNNTTNNPGGKGKAPEDLPAGTTIEWSGYYLVGDKRYGEGTQQLTILNETDCRSIGELIPIPKPETIQPNSASRSYKAL